VPHEPHVNRRGPRSVTTIRDRAGWRRTLLRRSVRRIDVLARGSRSQSSRADEHATASDAWTWGADEAGNRNRSQGGRDGSARRVASPPGSRVGSAWRVGGGWPAGIVGSPSTGPIPEAILEGGPGKRGASPAVPSRMDGLGRAGPASPTTGIGIGIGTEIGIGIGIDLLGSCLGPESLSPIFNPEGFQSDPKGRSRSRRRRTEVHEG